MFFDTDCGGVVSNIAYLRFIEIARTHLAEELGLALREMAEKQTYPVVVRTEIDYRRAAKLGDRLVKHFAMEEDGGYFADVLLHAPQLISKANALLAQHPKMCAQAREITAEVSPRKPAGDEWWQHTGELFRDFREELNRHEKQEDGLLQEAYSRDIGAND